MDFFINILRGLAIGTANIIPGVSGGTMALLLGIYDRLLSAISSIGLDTISKLKNGTSCLAETWEKIDGNFLICLGVGAGISIVAMARVMTMLLEKYHDPTYGFFFGLVLASILVPWKMIKQLKTGAIISMVLAIGLTMALNLAMTGEERLASAQKKAALKAVVSDSAVNVNRVSEEPVNLVFFFAGGAIAISAMILPGISGSFMMLLLGIYFDLLICINERQILPLVFFAAGCLAGLLIFTRFLKFLLSRFHDQTMGFLTGLVIGSLYGIWPFKSFGEAGGRRVDIANIIPSEFGGNEALTIFTVMTGVAIVAAFVHIEKLRQKN